jgi:hypothetical protein
MVSPIDAINSGMGFDEAGRWHSARPAFFPARRRESDESPLAPARGAIYGLLIGGAMWIGIIALVRVFIRLF